MIDLDNVFFKTEVLIVPDDALDDIMIVGRSPLSQRSVKVAMESGRITITKEETKKDH